MKSKRGKLKDGTKTGFGLLVDSVLEAASNTGAEIAKEYITDFAGEMAIDTVSSFLPGINGAISSYKRIRAEKNLTTLINHIHDKQEKLIENLKLQTEENRKKLDELLQYILGLAAEEFQECKIEYMVNGYLKLTEHEEVTSDFVMHYYDTLKQLRMVDIAVLRLYYQNLTIMPNSSERENYQDVMDRHGMSYEQYNSVRETLKRYGLLELEIKDDTEDDITKLETGINKIVALLEHLNKGKKTSPPKIAKVKVKQKTRESIKISKFGREFNKFFYDSK